MKKFGITLTKVHADFIKKIEEDFGQPISEIVRGNLEPAEYGYNRVEDGKPVIELNEETGVNVETLMHEAYELRMKFDGWPSLAWHLPPPQNTETNKQYLKWVTGRLWDRIIHTYHFPKLEELGLDPYAETTNEIKKILDEKHISGLRDATRKDALALYYLQCYVQSKREGLLNRFKDFYKSEYGDDGLRAITFGDNLVEIFRSTSVTNPDEAIRLFKRAVQAFVGKQARVYIHDRQKKQFGNYLQLIVFFGLKPR